jgi:signal transduction histidine kinase
MRSIMDRTAGRIRFLTDELQVDESAVAALEDAARAQGQAVRITRRQLLEMLAEIAQELCQPLSVVQCSLDMVSSRMLGEVSDSQMEMLKLALESVTRLQGLVEGLRTVAGVPQSLTPDPGVLDRMAGKAKPGARA